MQNLLIVATSAVSPFPPLAMQALDPDGFLVDTIQGTDWRVADLVAPGRDLILVDLPFPAPTLWDRLRRVAGVVPTIAVLHSDSETQTRRAFAAGVVDVVHWPLTPPLLRGHVHAALGSPPPGSSSFNDGVLEIDLDHRLVRLLGRPVRLRPAEFRLLAALLRRRDRVLTHQALIRELWGDEDPTRISNLHVYVSRLRRRIEPDPDIHRYIITVHNVGYRFQSRPPHPR